MNRIDKAFKLGKKENRPLFIAYLMAGDPHLEETPDLIAALEKGGTDLIELGVPFSDPIADGLVNQQAATRALKTNTTLKKILETVTQLRQTTQIPIVLFSYLNPILQYENFAEEASKAGVDGVLILDLPPEEGEDYRKTFKQVGLKTISLISPTTPKERIKKIDQKASGFIYYVSRLGVTGVKEDLDQDLEKRLEEIKKETHIPIAVGFGISKPHHITQLAPHCDGIVVGSAIVKTIEEATDKAMRIQNLTHFVHSLTKELKK